MITRTSRDVVTKDVQGIFLRGRAREKSLRGGLNQLINTARITKLSLVTMNSRIVVCEGRWVCLYIYLLCLFDCCVSCVYCMSCVSCMTYLY